MRVILLMNVLVRNDNAEWKPLDLLASAYPLLPSDQQVAYLAPAGSLQPASDGLRSDGFEIGLSQELKEGERMQVGGFSHTYLDVCLRQFCSKEVAL